MVNCQSEESAIILMQLPCILPPWWCVIAQPYLVGWQDRVNALGNEPRKSFIYNVQFTICNFLKTST